MEILKTLICFAKEKNCYDYYPFIILPDKWLLKPLQLFSASLKKLRFEIHQKITISVEEALTFNQDWIHTLFYTYEKRE